MNTKVINKARNEWYTMGESLNYMSKAIAEIITNCFDGNRFYFSDEDNFKKVGGWQYLFVDKDGTLKYHEDKWIGPEHLVFDSDFHYVNHIDYKYLLDLVWAEAHGKTASQYAKSCGYLA